MNYDVITASSHGTSLGHTQFHFQQISDLLTSWHVSSHEANKTSLRSIIDAGSWSLLQMTDRHIDDGLITIFSSAWLIENTHTLYAHDTRHGHFHPKGWGMGIRVLLCYPRSSFPFFVSVCLPRVCVYWMSLPMLQCCMSWVPVAGPHCTDTLQLVTLTQH